MTSYPKIQSVFKRDMEDNGKMIMGEFSLPEFEYLKDCQWTFEEKLDGRNQRVFWQPQEIIGNRLNPVEFRGRTDKADMPDFLMNKLNEIFTYERMKVLGTTVDDYMCLFGEAIGLKIQGCGGNYNKDTQEFVLFDVKIGNWWLKREDVHEIGQKLGLKCAPVIGRGTIADMVKIVKKGFNSQWGDFLAEGIVARPDVEFLLRNGQRIITKLKIKDMRDGKFK